MRRLVPVAPVALAAMLLAACGSAPDDGAGTTRLTIASLMGQDSEVTQEEWSQQGARFQDLIAQCMTKEGWEYIPVVYPTGPGEWTAANELERRQREGYGFAYRTLNQGNDAAAVADAMAGWVDPNQVIVESLSEDEKIAYDESLSGTPEEQEAAQASEDYYTSASERPGCEGEAYRAVYGQDPTRGDEYALAVAQFYLDLGARVDADPRVKALDAEWSTCMKAAGFDYNTRDEIYETAYTDLQARHDEIVGDLVNRDPFEGMSEAEIQDFLENSTQEEIDARLPVSPSLTDDQRAALEAMLADEIDMAVAEWKCSAPYDERYKDIATQVEKQYATEHRTELEALTASFGVSP